jgi:hypothetical protein
LVLIITTVNSLFCVGHKRINRTFESVVSREKATLSTGNLVHF